MARRNKTVDDSGLSLKAAALVGASAAGTLKPDLGAGFVEGNVIIDVTALEIASNDEIYDIILQLSPDSTFGTDTNIKDQAAINLSAAEVKRSDSNVDDAIGRYIMPFNNMNNGTVLRYARIYTVVAGTIGSGGINYSARISKL